MIDKKLYDSIVEHYGKEKADEMLVLSQRQYRRIHDSNSIDYKAKPKQNIVKRQKVRKKAEKRRKKRQWKSQIEAFAQELEENLPKSEVWFRDLYLKHFHHKDDQFNKDLSHTYIPDVHNRKFKYVIEIDGSMHETSDQIKKDIKKNNFYKLKGYDVFRLKAYNEKQYIQLIYWLIDKRLNTEQPTDGFNKYCAIYRGRNSFVNQGDHCSNSETPARGKPKTQTDT